MRRGGGEGKRTIALCVLAHTAVCASGYLLVHVCYLMYNMYIYPPSSTRLSVSLIIIIVIVTSPDPL